MSNEILLAGYSLWANEVVYEVVAQLPEEEIVRVRTGTTFGSLLHTLGHSYAVGAIFKGHLERRPHGFTTRRVPDTTTFSALRDMQRKLDVWYAAWADRVQDGELADPIRFQFVDGGEAVMTQGEMFLHVVNHYTYHRGFAVEMLRGMSVDVPATDIPVYIRDRV